MIHHNTRLESVAVGIKRSPQVSFILALPLLLCFVVSVASANEITLGTNSSATTPLLLDASDLTANLLVTISSNGEPTNQADFVSGWQIYLVITPDPNATGTVQFQSPTVPVEYLFDEISQFGLNAELSATSSPNDTIFAYDFNFPFQGGAEVPLTPPANLLSVEVQASANANGTFGVFAITGAGNTEWSDASQPVIRSHAFVNEPNNAGLARIGEIFVSTRLAGDLNADQNVDRSDVALFVSQLGRTEETSFDTGDFDGDQRVSIRDLALLQGNLSAPSPSPIAVPEPSTCLSTILGLLCLVLQRRRRRYANDCVAMGIITIDAKQRVDHGGIGS